MVWSPYATRHLQQPLPPEGGPMQITCAITTDVDGIHEEVRVEVTEVTEPFAEAVSAILEAARSSVTMLEERRRLIL